MDWKSEKGCFSTFINETAEFYCLKDKTGARWIQWKYLAPYLCRWDSEQHTGVEVDWRDTVEQVEYGHSLYGLNVYPMVHSMECICHFYVFHTLPLIKCLEPGDLFSPQKPSFTTALLPHRFFHTPGPIITCVMLQDSRLYTIWYSRVFSCVIP